MKSTSYKYINLVVRLAIGGLALWFIYDHFKGQLGVFTNMEIWSGIKFVPLFFAAVLMLVNWGIESYKWKYLLRDVSEVSLFNALGIVFTGITIGLVTPNRIGEIPGRVWLLPDKTIRSKAVALTAVGAFGQMLVTLIVGTIASWQLMEHFFQASVSVYLCVLLTVVCFLLFFFYLKSEGIIRFVGRVGFLNSKNLIDGISALTLEKLFINYIFSSLRYLVFWIQFYLVLEGFGIPLTEFGELLLIPFCFMVASFIPTVLISELLVRGSVALLIFGLVSELDAQIIMASVTLWAINVAIPAVIGIPGLRKLKIVGS